jgi:hypothetical protein
MAGHGIVLIHISMLFLFNSMGPAASISSNTTWYVSREGRGGEEGRSGHHIYRRETVQGGRLKEFNNNLETAAPMRSMVAMFQNRFSMNPRTQPGVSSKKVAAIPYYIANAMPCLQSVTSSQRRKSKYIYCT